MVSSFQRNAWLRPALIRLEDVGPGGSYATVEDLGRLRAVFEYLVTERVPFHVALVPRWKNIRADGTWYNKGIDTPNPNNYVKRFIRLMRTAEKNGAILGMHGYTHQYGDTLREDHNQDSGIGSEFNLEGVPETATAAYALARFQKSLAAFQQAKLYPAFWESPHYNDTKQQEEIFASLISVLYQPDADLRAVHHPYVTENGAVFIPTPLDYIHDQNTVDQVLDKLADLRELASLFYHPYLEFQWMQPVTDLAGNAVIRDGLPEYRYRPNADSDLKRIVECFRQRGYQWVSFYKILPFTPARRF